MSVEGVIGDTVTAVEYASLKDIDGGAGMPRHDIGEKRKEK
jgi:hypothetical protein